MTNNPFEITKAVDFTDEEIGSMFVEYPNGGYLSFAHPAGVMPKYLIGGKGGGRTHLLRWYSYLLQKQRRDGERSVLSQLQYEGYMGVYFRCSGLNGARFTGKRQTDDVWAAVFSYYFDVWLTEHLLNVLADLQATDQCWTELQQVAFGDAARGLFTDDIDGVEGQSNTGSIERFRRSLTAVRQTMDRVINNVALQGTLDIQILSSPGALVFGTASAAEHHLPGLSGLRFTFLIDEFENFTTEQQRYVNSLIREKQLPVGFLVGSRQWGLTFESNSGGEVNKKGSEFETVVLEDAYKNKPAAYHDFCSNLALSRIRAAGYPAFKPEDLDRSFYGSRADSSENELALTLVGDKLGINRPHFARLDNQISQASGGDRKLSSTVLEILRIDDKPLLEKAAVLRFYRSWSTTKKISTEAARSAASYVGSLGTAAPADGAEGFYKHWKADLLAQLCVENGQKIPYLGFSQFVDMSGFLPRSFLTTIKYVVSWADFIGEEMFVPGAQISADAQISGVMEASGWFARDALPDGVRGEECDRAVRRLGSLLRRFRYSDKPTEVSCSSFSTDLHGVVPDAVDLIDTCVNHNLLLEILSGRSGRNQGTRLRKFQIHPMIAPLYSLPTVRRGELTLNRDEVNSIFDPASTAESYNSVAKRRLLPLRAPFNVGVSDQESLFDFS